MPSVLLPGPLAQNGDKQEIPLLQDGATPNRMSYDLGTPAICSEDPNEGGLPPRRADMNQVHYMLSTILYELQKGEKYVFDAFMTQPPNSGYGDGAILWDPNTKQYLQSTKANNTDNYVTTPSFIGTSWIPVFATASLDNLNAVGQGKLDAKLSRSGGQMTGEIQFIASSLSKMLIQLSNSKYVDVKDDGTGYLDFLASGLVTGLYVGPAGQVGKRTVNTREEFLTSSTAPVGIATFWEGTHANGQPAFYLKFSNGLMIQGLKSTTGNGTTNWQTPFTSKVISVLFGDTPLNDNEGSAITGWTLTSVSNAQKYARRYPFLVGIGI